MTPRPAPPGISRALLLLLVPRDQRESIDGDLHEGFRDAAERRGQAWARRWYRAQVLRSVWPLLTADVTWSNLPRLAAGTAAALVFVAVAPELLSRAVLGLGPQSSWNAPDLEALRVGNLIAAVTLAPLAGHLAARLSAPCSITGVTLAALALAFPGIAMALQAPDLGPRWVAVVWVLAIPPLTFLGGNRALARMKWA